MSIVYAGIDGTGEDDDNSYTVTFADSFVNRLYQRWPYQDPKIRFYNRGPRLWGTETAEYAGLAFDHVQEAMNIHGGKAIFLAGYSRGGAAVIEVAKRLKEVGKEVECLILFDAVDRSHKVGRFFRNTPIPSTVKYVIHAMRMPEARSRESFGNCGTRYEAYDPARHYTKEFYATHAALGGTLWPSPDPQTIKRPHQNFVYESGDGYTVIPFEQDKLSSPRVWDWVNPKVQQILKNCQLRLQHIPIKHRSTPLPLP